MASNQAGVITAIRDMQQEGFIAAALSRLEWKVVYRATDASSLVKFLTTNPDCLVLASDDFKGIENLKARDLILLRGLSQPLIVGAVESPSSDSELHHLMHSFSQGDAEKRVEYQKIKTSVYTVASLGRNVGTTFVAINLATEIAQQNRSVLLIDSHPANPCISRYLALHDLREKVIETDFGFSVTEIASTERIQELTELASEFDVVVIDLGELQLNELTTVGGRLSDVLTTWALKSSERLHFVSDIRIHSNRDLKSKLQFLSKVAEIPYIDRVVKLSEISSKREIAQFQKCSEAEIGIPAFIYPYDRRATQALWREQRPLLLSATKSTLRAQIQNHLQACENRVQLKAR